MTTRFEIESIDPEGEVRIGFRGQFVTHDKLLSFANHMGYLCGEMIATLSIERNRETLKNAEHADKWIAMFDRWKERYAEIIKKLESP